MNLFPHCFIFPVKLEKEAEEEELFSIVCNKVLASKVEKNHDRLMSQEKVISPNLLWTQVRSHIYVSFIG